MSYEFDDLARAIARGISRREALKRMGAGLAGLLLVSLGIRKALAAVSCGTCQSCDLDTNTCGLPCTPASAGQSLCTMASSDGSYLRLANFLSLNGFALAGVSDSVLLYKSGSLFQSGMLTNFNNPSVSGETAVIAYAVSPQGAITSFAVVAQNGAPVYGLSVDFNGRIIQTVATQAQSTKASVKRAETSPFAIGSVQHTQTPARAIPRTVNSGAVSTPELITGLSPQVCDYIVGILCGTVSTIDCIIVGAVLCAAESLLTFLIGAVPCGIAVAAICGPLYTVACAVLTPDICDCAFNTQYCEGVCCGPCQDCSPSGACVPANNVAACASKVCCNGQCCPNGYTCDTTTTPPSCKSPNSGCLGATCATFVPCSSSNPDCVCGTITEGGGLCVPGSTPCAGLASCATSGDCGPDALCLIGSCCGEPVCVPIALAGQCPASTDATAVKPQVKKPRVTTGPTLGHR